MNNKQNKQKQTARRLTRPYHVFAYNGPHAGGEELEFEIRASNDDEALKAARETTQKKNETIRPRYPGDIDRFFGVEGVFHTPPYRYTILDPQKKDDPEQIEFLKNNKVLGIEITIPEIAKLCSLGNIDPQHSGKNATKTAIEVATGIDLPAQEISFGPKGAVLATIRTDNDALGAMAVLTMRANGIDVSDKKIQKQIKTIAESDRFARGPWPGPRPLPSSKDIFAGEKQPLAAVGAAMSDLKFPIENKIEFMKNWIFNAAQKHEDKEFQTLREQYGQKAEAERKEVAEALEKGEIKVSTILDGKIAIVESAHRAATSIGYRLAPVVIAINPAFRFRGGEPHRKITICQYESGHVDLGAVRQKLAEIEPGWGGSPTIIGSPQGKQSEVDFSKIMEMVESSIVPVEGEEGAKNFRGKNIKTENINIGDILAVPDFGKFPYDCSIAVAITDYSEKEGVFFISPVLHKPTLISENDLFVPRWGGATIEVWNRIKVPARIIAELKKVGGLSDKYKEYIQKYNKTGEMPFEAPSGSSGHLSGWNEELRKKINEDRTFWKEVGLQIKHSELSRICRNKGLNPTHPNQKRGKMWKQIVCMKKQLAGAG